MIDKIKKLLFISIYFLSIPAHSIEPKNYKYDRQENMENIKTFWCRTEQSYSYSWKEKKNDISNDSMEFIITDINYKDISARRIGNIGDALIFIVNNGPSAINFIEIFPAGTDTISIYKYTDVRGKFPFTSSRHVTILGTPYQELSIGYCEKR